MDPYQVISLVVVVAINVAAVTASHVRLAGRLDAQKDKVQLAIHAHEKDCSNYDPNTGIRAAK